MRKNQTHWSVAAGLLTVMLIAAAVTLFAHTTSAQAATRHYGPIASTSPDSGTCGNFWAMTPPGPRMEARDMAGRLGQGVTEGSGT